MRTPHSSGNLSVPSGVPNGSGGQPGDIVDARANHAASLSQCFQCQRYEIADRGKDDCGIKRFRRHLIGPIGPSDAELKREFLRWKITRTGECKYRPALPSCGARLQSAFDHRLRLL